MEIKSRETKSANITWMGNGALVERNGTLISIIPNYAGRLTHSEIHITEKDVEMLAEFVSKSK